MTVSTTLSKVLYTGNGSITSFAYTFRLDNDSDMKVYLDAVLQGSGYTVNKDPDFIGGTVVFSVAPANGVVISLVRELDLTQTTDYVPYDPFPAEAHEDALDKLTMISQQLQEQVSRSVLIPIDGTFSNVELPPYDAGKALMWHESVAGTLDTSTDNVNGIVSAAQAAQAAAETAETNAATSASNAATSATNSANSATASAGYRDDAMLWATEAEDILVNDGVNPPNYSAYHYMLKAQAVAPSTDAINVTYDNVTSGLTATNVQDAIDEILTIPAGLQWSFQTLSFGTATNNGYLCDGGITVTLHAGSVGDVVALADADGTFGASPLTVVGNVEGDAGGLVLDIDKAYVELVYDGATWQIANFNANGLTPNAVTFLEAKSGRKNAIINGNFDVWQRGTTNTVDGYGAADRWYDASGGSTKVASRQPFTFGQTAVPFNPTYFHRTVVTSVAGASNYVILSQRIEDVSTFASETVTVSLWAQSDAARPIAVNLQQYFGGGGGGSATVSLAGQKVTLSTSWAKYTFQFDLPSIFGKTLGASGDDCVKLLIWFDAGSNYDFQTDTLGQQSGNFNISQVQVERGTVATDFDLRPMQEELFLCQRYYQHFQSINAVHTIGSGVALSTTSARGVVHLFTPLRALCTLRTTGVATDYEVLTTSQHTCTAVPVIGVNSISSPELIFTTTGITAGHGCTVRTRVVGAYVGFDAEI